MSSIDVHRQHYNVTFTLLALAAIAFALLHSLVAPALLTIQHDLHTTTATSAWILSAYLLRASVLTPIFAVGLLAPAAHMSVGSPEDPAQPRTLPPALSPADGRGSRRG